METMDDQTERITVNITRKTANSLNSRAIKEQVTKTDIVNRSINAYAYLAEIQDDGWNIILRNEQGIEERVRFL
jgi:hypothetical protein